MSLNCANCHYEVEDDDICRNNFCPQCGTKFETVGESLELAGAWRRYWARTFDLLFEFLIFNALYVWGSLYISEAVYEFIDKVPDILFSLGVLIIAFVIDSIIFMIFGGTLGKYLFGMKIIDSGHKKIRPLLYWERNFWVYVSGYGLGLYVLNLSTVAWQYVRLSKGKRASYDETLNLQVVINKKSLLKTSLGILLFLFFIAVYSAIMLSSFFID